MKFSINPLVAGVAAPPIAEVMSWVSGRNFSEELPAIDLLQAVPGYPPDERLTAFLSRTVLEPESALYTEIEGILPLRRRLASHMAEIYGGAIEPAQLSITAGCNQAFYVAVIALARAGDEIIIPTPYYFNHKMTLDMLGIRARMLPCREAERFVPNPDEAEELIDPRTRAIALITPNNPTGAVYPPDTVGAFFDLASRHGVPLIIDETYRDFLPVGMERPHHLFSRSDWPETLIHLYSFSKVYCITGYRVGALAASPAFIGQVSKIMDCVAICAPKIGQLAALHGIEFLGDWRAANRALMQARIQGFCSALEESNAAFTIASIGAYFAYMRHPAADQASVDVARKLATEKNILCLPGSVFGPGQEPYLRFAFANVDASIMPTLARRLTQ